jgi:[acyl-carrier-protein] S-malonyltransferase
VRWVECIRLLKQSGANFFIEVGPGRVLGNLNKKIDHDLANAHVDDPASLAKTIEKLTARR